MIKHDEVRQHLSMWSRSARPLMREYITQQEQRERDLLMQVTEYGMSEMELKKLVKELIKLLNLKEDYDSYDDGDISKTYKMLCNDELELIISDENIIKLYETIKKMVGV